MLLGCAPPDPQAEAGETVAERDLAGTYVVTFVNEEAPLIAIEGHEPTVTISADRVHFQSQCIYHDWSYARDGETMETGPWDYGGKLVGMCARGLAPGEEAIIAAIDGADTVRFVAHGLWMDGDGGTIQMRFVPSEEQLARRAVDLTGEWQIMELDGRPLGSEYGPISLTADWNSVWWEPGCAGQGVSYTIEGSAFDAQPPGNPGLVCDIGFPEELPGIWAAMAETDSIERTASGSVLISGDGRSVLLAPQDGDSR